MSRTRIAVITCYHDPDYVRARSLRAALASLPGTSIIVIKNRHHGMLRYPEVLWAILRTRLQLHPDAYLLTFRGQEILPIVRLLTVHKPLWFDEFVVPKAYATKEAYKLTPGRFVRRLLLQLNDPLYKFCLKRVSCILSDTASHAETSAKLYEINLRKYLPVPVGTDEKLFYPVVTKPQEVFQVFYYSTNMQPLHGIPYVLDAARILKDDETIRFLLIGGKAPMAHAAQQAITDGAHIDYRSSVPFDELAKIMRTTTLNIGGPFGGTYQAEHVITGKTFQSLAAAIPTLIGKNRETEHYFSDKLNALVVPQADAAALAKAIRWAVSHPTELRNIGEKGRKVYERCFSTKAIADILSPLVENLRTKN